MCLKPIFAAFDRLPKSSRDKCRIHFNPTKEDYLFGRVINLPCGKCDGCLEDKSRRWVSRLLLEFDNIGFGSFITLTYADAPLHPSKDDVQKFLKRFRNASRDYGVSPFPNFKYFIVAEHGSECGRVHYHGLMFGVDCLASEWLPRVVYFKRSGDPVCTSGVLESIWGHGFVTVDSITSGRCNYIAKYMMKQDGQEDNFSLKSMRLGVSSFFDVRRVNRKYQYRYRRVDSFDRLLDGVIHVSDKGSPLKVNIPSSLINYVKRISEDDFYTIKDARIASNRDYLKSFDFVAYSERLREQKEKLKQRILH